MGDILDRFHEANSDETADSGAKDGPNQPTQPPGVEAAIEPETLSELSQQTGLSKEELLCRMGNESPQAIGKLTPDGVVPNEAPRSSEPNLLDDRPELGYRPHDRLRGRST